MSAGRAERIRALLPATHGLTVTDIEEVGDLNLPEDTSPRAVYHIVTDHGQHLAVKIAYPSTAAMALATHLVDSGVTAVGAPMPTRKGAFVAPTDAGPLSVYPWIDGRRATEVGMTLDQWRELGRVMRQIHDTPPTNNLIRVLPRVDLSPTGLANRIASIQLTAYGESLAGDPIAGELAALWQANQARLNSLARQVLELGAGVRHLPRNLVISHGALHLHRILVGPGGIQVIDWDRPLLATREADLHAFVTGAMGNLSVPADAREAFFEGYGAVDLDPARIRFHLGLDVMSHLSLAESVLDQPWGATARRASLAALRRALGPGGALETALLA